MSTEIESMTGEVRLADPDLPDVLARVVDALEHDRPAQVRFAAEGSAHPVLFVPYEAIVPGRPEARYPVASVIGVGPGSLLVVRGAVGEGPRDSSAWWMDPPGPHHLTFVEDHWTANRVDAVAFTILLNLVEFARQDALPEVVLDWLRDVVEERWLPAVGGGVETVDYGDHAIRPRDIRYAA